MSTIYEEEHEMVEELAGDLYSPAGDGELNLPNAWGTLKIDMTMMLEEQRQKVYAAELLLREAGIGFDVSSGGGYREWELDWSLSGAYLYVKTFHCMGEAKNEKHPMGDDLSWAIVRHPDGAVLSYVFCSPECREEEVGEVVEGGYELIVNIEG